MISPTVLNTPHGTQDIPPHLSWIPPRYWTPPTVLKISPHGTHDIPHGTEHPHGTAHTLYRVITHWKVLWMAKNNICAISGSLKNLSLLIEKFWGRRKITVALSQDRRVVEKLVMTHWKVLWMAKKTFALSQGREYRVGVTDYLRPSLARKGYGIKPGFHMIVGDRSRSLVSLVKCSAIVTIIWKPNFHFASDHQRSQRLPTIATITIAGIESESILRS